MSASQGLRVSESGLTRNGPLGAIHLSHHEWSGISGPLSVKVSLNSRLESHNEKIKRQGLGQKSSKGMEMAPRVLVRNGSNAVRVNLTKAF